MGMETRWKMRLPDGCSGRDEDDGGGTALELFLVREPQEGLGSIEAPGIALGFALPLGGPSSQNWVESAGGSVGRTVVRVLLLLLLWKMK